MELTQEERSIAFDFIIALDRLGITRDNNRHFMEMINLFNVLQRLKEKYEHIH